MKRLAWLTLAALWMMSPAFASAQNPVVIFDTSKGKIVIELDEKAAPITVKNFLKYVDDKHYDGTIFHRVIADFMVQGGGFDGDMREKGTRDPIKNESTNGLENKRGTVAMARTAVPDSASAQFFINVKDNEFLNKAKARDGVGYAVFGRVIDGMDVVDLIRQVPTTTRAGHENVPETPVIVRSARRK
jgi:cyclophilin family peptidyl-prolyl cis-trans isomerase